MWADGTLEAGRQAAASVTFGGMPMRRILRSHVEAWVKEMSTSLAASTTRMRYNYVHMAFRAAVRDKIIREAPSDGVALPKLAKAETTMVIPTPELVATARRACTDPAFVGFIAVCAYAGLRLGEAAGLQVGDVDFLRREIRVRRQVQGQTRSSAKVVPPKAGSARTVYVSDELVELLSRHVRDIGTWGDEG
jgi:integrase